MKTDRRCSVLVTPLIEAGDLFSMISTSPTGRLTEVVAKRLFRGLLAALDFLHARRIRHGDVKLENIVVDRRSGRALLCDFGLAHRLSNDEPSRNDSSIVARQGGSPNYAAPEILRASRNADSALPSRYGNTVGVEADVWACGVALYTAVLGQYPFHDECRHRRYRRILEGCFHPFPSAATTEFCEFVSRMLDVDVDRRWKTSQLLRHRWLLSGDCEELPPSATKSVAGRKADDYVRSPSTSAAATAVEKSTADASRNLPGDEPSHCAA